MNKTYTSLVLTALVALTTGCGTSFALAADPSVPFAAGEVSASFVENGNNAFEVEVHHLGDPSKLNPKATTYVVWATPKKDGATIQNVGALKVDSDYSGKLEFTTAFSQFVLTITPEPSAEVSVPTGRDVLKGNIAR